MKTLTLFFSFSFHGLYRCYLG